jgi:hypothetical protein
MEKTPNRKLQEIAYKNTYAEGRKQPIQYLGKEFKVSLNNIF